MKGADIVKHTSTYNWDPLNKYINSVIQFSFPSSRSSMNMQGCTLIISEDPIEINYIKYIQINNFPSLSPLPSGTFRYIPQKVTATSHSSGITQPLPIQTFWVGIKMTSVLCCVSRTREPKEESLSGGRNMSLVLCWQIHYWCSTEQSLGQFWKARGVTATHHWCVWYEKGRQDLELCMLSHFSINAYYQFVVMNDLFYCWVVYSQTINLCSVGNE